MFRGPHFRFTGLRPGITGLSPVILTPIPVARAPVPAPAAMVVARTCRLPANASTDFNALSVHGQATRIRHVLIFCFFVAVTKMKEEDG